MRGLTRGKYLDEPENICITRPHNITGRGVTHTRWYGHGHIGHSGGHRIFPWLCPDNSGHPGRGAGCIYSFSISIITSSVLGL